MAERTTRGAGELAWRGLLVAIAIVGSLATIVAPRWESFVHAQSYGEFGSIADEALRPADDERRVVDNRLQQARDEQHPRRWGTFLTLDRNTIRRSPSQRENGFDT